MLARLTKLTFIALVAVAMAATGAVAYWTTLGGGSGSAPTASLTKPVVTVPTSASGAVTVSWTASTLNPSIAAANSQINYTVERSGNSGADWDAACGGGTINALTCDDAPPATGNYVYRVTAHLNSWTEVSATSTSVAYTAPGGGDTDTPDLTTLEMFDADKNGKIDQVKATFDEDIEASTATDPWVLSNPPSGGTLASVSTTGAIATLILTEDPNASADTAAENFTVGLNADPDGIRDAAQNESSFAATAPSDKAAPATTGIEMFDTTSPLDGKVDEVEATFSEDLATPYAAGTGVWTLANAPGGSTNTVAGVAVNDDVATLTLNQGNANTAAGIWSGAGAGANLAAFTAALAAHEDGIRDADGNQTSFTAKSVTDKASPIPTTLTFARATSGTDNAIAGRPSTNDLVHVAFSEPLAVGSMCAGAGTAGWSVNTNDQNLNSNANGEVVLRIENNTAPTTANDRLTVLGHGTSGRCATASRFGALDLGSAAYVSGALDMTATGSASRPEVRWTFSTRTLTFELGTPSASTVTTNPVTAIYAPATGMTDIPGNAVAGTVSRTGSAASNF